MNTSVKIGNLTLKNPFIVSSCSLTANPANFSSYEKAGASAIVLKSIFQEDILAELATMDTSIHPESYDYLGQYHEEACIENYCNLIQESKKACSIPVIASVSCTDANGWAAYAKRFQDAGADAIELNVMRIESSTSYSYGDLEKQHVDILKAVKKTISIPVIMKIGHCLTNVSQLVSDLTAAGATAVVLFNKMCPVDIDIENINYKMGKVMSGNTEIYDVLRWTALSSARVPSSSILASGGIIDGQSLIKAILSGAKATEVCSVIYEKGAEAISEMVTFLNTWMEKHGYNSIDEFRGNLNASKHEGAEHFERIQFVKNISKAK